MTQSPKDLFFDQLRDLHSVETQLIVSLPTLKDRTTYPPLAALIAHHAGETERQLGLILAIFQAHGVDVGNDKCKAMEGLIKGGDRHLDQVHVPETRDLMMIAHCLRIEHYEIAAYGITGRLAGQLGFGEEASLLAAILAEEKHAAAKLEELEPILLERATPRLAV